MFMKKTVLPILFILISFSLTAQGYEAIDVDLLLSFGAKKHQQVLGSRFFSPKCSKFALPLFLAISAQKKIYTSTFFASISISCNAPEKLLALK